MIEKTINREINNNPTIISSTINEKLDGLHIKGKHIGIVGCIDSSKDSFIEEVIRALEERGAEVVVIGAEEARDRGITILDTAREEAIKLTNIMRPLMFTPPLTRRERRKLNRKNKKS